MTLSDALNICRWLCENGIKLWFSLRKCTALTQLALLDNHVTSNASLQEAFTSLVNLRSLNLSGCSSEHIEPFNPEDLHQLTSLTLPDGAYSYWLPDHEDDHTWQVRDAEDASTSEETWLDVNTISDFEVPEGVQVCSASRSFFSMKFSSGEPTTLYAIQPCIAQCRTKQAGAACIVSPMSIGLLTFCNANVDVAMQVLHMRTTNACTCAEADWFACMVSQLPSLRHLTCSLNQNVSPLGQAPPSWPCLRQLRSLDAHVWCSVEAASRCHKAECCASHLQDALTHMRHLTRLALEFKCAKESSQPPVHGWGLVQLIHCGRYMPALASLSITNASLIASNGLRSYMRVAQQIAREKALSQIARHGLTSLTLAKCPMRFSRTLGIHPHRLQSLALRWCTLCDRSLDNLKSTLQACKGPMLLNTLDLTGNKKISLSVFARWQHWLTADSKAATASSLRKVHFPSGLRYRCGPPGAADNAVALAVYQADVENKEKGIRVRFECAFSSDDHL